jgi:sirohydrochlorin cobaltochelatase
MGENTETITEIAFDVEERRRKAELSKPMSSAPMRYTDDGAVDWGDMWDSFCVLASAGGPAHRDTLLVPEAGVDPSSEAYQTVQSEIIRGVYLVSGLQARPAVAGWIAVECPMEGMAAWVAEQGVQENVQIQQHGSDFWVPCGQRWTVKGEVKNVVTVVAKTTHYFADHISNDMKTTMIMEEGLSKVGALIKGLFGRS